MKRRDVRRQLQRVRRQPGAVGRDDAGAAAEPVRRHQGGGRGAARRVQRQLSALDTASLRYFNIFGPRQNANSAYAAVIAAFAKAMLAGQRPVIYGDGEQSRDFTFVANAVHANLLAARHDASRIDGRVAQRRLRRADLGERTGQADGIRDGPARTCEPVHEPERAGDLKHSFADLARSRAVLGYQPIVDFRSGLEQTVRWYESVLPAGPAR